MKNIVLLLSIFLTIANCSMQKPIKHHGVHKLNEKQVEVNELFDMLDESKNITDEVRQLLTFS